MAPLAGVARKWVLGAVAGVAGVASLIGAIAIFGGGESGSPNRSKETPVTTTPDPACDRVARRLWLLTDHFSDAHSRAAEIFNKYDSIDEGREAKLEALDGLFNTAVVFGSKLQGLDVPPPLERSLVFLSNGFEDARRGAELMARAVEEQSASLYNQARLQLNGSDRLVDRVDKESLQHACRPRGGSDSE